MRGCVIADNGGSDSGWSVKPLPGAGPLFVITRDGRIGLGIRSGIAAGRGGGGGGRGSWCGSL